MRELSKAEEYFLNAIWRLKDNAYGVSKREKIYELTGKMYTYGTLYKILDKMFQKLRVSRQKKEVEGENCTIS